MPFFTEVVNGAAQTIGTFGGSETVTFRFRLFYFDEVDGSGISIEFTALGTVQLTAKNLRALNPTNARFRAVGVSMKSSISASGVTGRLNLTARQM